MREVIPTDQSEYMGVTTPSAQSTPTLPANHATPQGRKIENIVRMGKTNKFSIDDICNLTYSGVLEADLFYGATTLASEEALKALLKNSPLSTGPFKSYCVWVIGILDAHNIEIDLE